MELLLDEDLQGFFVFQPISNLKKAFLTSCVHFLLNWQNVILDSGLEAC